MTNQKGISSSIMIIIIIMLIIGGGLVWYLVSQDESVEQKTNVNYAAVTNANTNINANTDTNNDWPAFTNNNYHFRFSYPSNWFYIPDAMSGPPPPAISYFASTASTAGTDYSSFHVYAADLNEESLDTWSEIELLEEDGWIRSDINFAGEPAVRLERDTHPSDTGAIIHVIKDDYKYRIIWGSTTQALDQANSAIQEQMADSFEFIEPLVADFEQSGNLSKPEGENYWNLVWEEPGSPALYKKLTFDAMDFISICISGSSQSKCTDAMTNNLFGENATVVVQGILNPNDNSEVFVTYITEP